MLLLFYFIFINKPLFIVKVAEHNNKISKEKEDKQNTLIQKKEAVKNGKLGTSEKFHRKAPRNRLTEFKQLLKNIFNFCFENRYHGIIN